MYISEDESRERIGGKTNLLNRIKIEREKNHPDIPVAVLERKRGRPAGKTKMDDDTKQAGAAIARLMGPSVAADVLDISYKRASDLKRGVHADQTPDEVIEEKGGKVDKIKEKALDLLLESLEQITPDDLLSKRGVMQTASLKNISHIFEKMHATKGPNSVSNTQVIVYAPQTKSLDRYDLIETNG